MDLKNIGDFINTNGLAMLILLGIAYGGYQILTPSIKKRLEKKVENEGQLEGVVSDNYFKLVSDTIVETRETNVKLLDEMGKISETNKELSKTNRRLVESYDKRICAVEDTTDEVLKTVDKINTKVDIIIK